MTGPRPYRVLELFSGLGGWRYALQAAWPALPMRFTAYDINPHANAAYRLNHGEAPAAQELAALPLDAAGVRDADLWAMSPPCQPYCRMGKGRDLEDPRSAAFLRLMEIFDACPPGGLLLENVEGFFGSRGHGLLVETLRKHGFHWLEWRLCPSTFGLPNRRPRAYLAASRRPLRAAAPPDLPAPPVDGFLDAEEDASLYLDRGTLERHGPGLDLVESGGTRTSCFIGGYGRRLVGSGSFLRTDQGIRRFSPAEEARLLGYPASFRFPETLPLQARYKLLGNGLSLPVATFVASHLVPD